jgi:hypothetical protein
MAKTKLKKISAFIPEALLMQASKLEQYNMTDTLIAGLKEIIGKHERMKALKSMRKLHFDYDVDQVRQRRVM